MNLRVTFNLGNSQYQKSRVIEKNTSVMKALEMAKKEEKEMKQCVGVTKSDEITGV